MPRVAISRSLVTIILEPISREEAVRLVATPLLAAGLVKQSYPQAILEREKSFPTGLPTVGVGVAIPHTDIEHVNEPAIAVGILRHPVHFQNMAEPDESIPVHLLFMLALNEPHAQIEMLQQLMGLVQDADLLQRLKEADSPDQAWGILEPSFQSLLA